MILCLAFLAAGLLFVLDKDPTRDAMAGTCLLLPAAIYILGWFYYIPESLGASSRSRRPLQERWTSWLRTSGLLGLACLVGWGVIGIVESDSVTGASIFFTFGAAAAYCVAVVMVLLRRHFGPEDLMVGSTQGPARRRWVDVFEKIGAPARHLANRLSPRVSLPSGGAMILASVLLVTSVDGCHSFRGHEVLQGKAAWLTAENMDNKASKAVATVAAYANYCVGLASALAIALAFVVRPPKRVSFRPQTARWLAFTNGVVALFTISDLALFGLARLGPILYCIMFLLYWVAPITVWLYYALAGKTRERWPIARSSLIILYLPVLFWSYGMLIVVAGFGAYGYLSYFIGIQLVWWGCIQVAPSIASRSTPVAQSAELEG